MLKQHYEDKIFKKTIENKNKKSGEFLDFKSLVE